jgi:hypothetical protein
MFNHAIRGHRAIPPKHSPLIDLGNGKPICESWRWLKTDPPTPFANSERRTKPISGQEKEMTEALNFLVKNHQIHIQEYHYKTDAAQVKRCESILPILDLLPGECWSFDVGAFRVFGTRSLPTANCARKISL